MRTETAQRDRQAARLKLARESAGFAKASDAIQKWRWKQSTYLAHENGQNGIRADSAIEYGRAYGVDPGWILTGVGRGPAKPKSEPDSPQKIPGGDTHEFTPVGRYDAAFSMGAGSLAVDLPEPMGHWLIETQWLRGLTQALPNDLAIVRVSGDSMSPTLHDGDWVLVDRQQVRISREGIYAIRVGDDAWVKRISLNLRDKLVRIISDNTAIPVQDVEEAELSVLGRVIAVVARRIP